MKTCDLHIIDEKAALLTATSDFIFDHPEPCYQEFQSAEYLMQALEKEGFRVLRHRRVSTNDEGLSLGQLMIAAAKLGK